MHTYRWACIVSPYSSDGETYSPLLYSLLFWYYVKKKYKLKVNFSYNILFLSSQFFHLIQFLLILILVFIW